MCSIYRHDVYAQIHERNCVNLHLSTLVLTDGDFVSGSLDLFSARSVTLDRGSKRQQGQCQCQCLCHRDIIVNTRQCCVYCVTLYGGMS